MKKDLDSIILTKTELDIMKVAWKLGEITTRDVLNAISKTKAVAYTTIATEIANLEKKGVLQKSKMSRAYSYKPLLSLQQAMDNHLKYLIENVFDDSSEDLIEFVIANMYDWRDLLKIIQSNRWSRSIMSVN